MIAYFGTGLLGSGFVRKMLERGETVYVWNRTFEKAQALEADGARAFRDPAQAVRGAAQIHLTLSDDDPVDGVLEPLAGDIGTDALIVDHTTTAPGPTGDRAKRWIARGHAFVHAPVFMAPQNARDGTGIMLLSGDPDLRAAALPILAPMTGKIVELGDDPARAAAFKLMGNMMLLVITGGLGDFFAFARTLGIEPQDAYTLFDAFNPGNMIAGGRGKQMAQGVFAPASFELSMARKDVRLMIDEARRHGTELDLVPAVASLFDRYLDAGFASDDVGVVASGKA